MFRGSLILLVCAVVGCGAAFEEDTAASGETSSAGGGAGAGMTAGGHGGAGLGGGTGGVGNVGESWASGFAARKRITIDTTFAEAALKDFPMPVLVADPDIHARAAADGRDVQMTSADGVTPLVHDVDHFDTDQIVIWMSTDIDPGSSPLVAFLYYGSDTASSASDPVATWDDYEAVFHLNEDFSSASQLEDAAGNPHGQVSPPYNDPATVASPVGDALSFSDDTPVSIARDASLDFDTDSFTLSTWLRWSGNGSTMIQSPIWNGSTDGNRGWALTIRGGNWTFEMSDGATHAFANYGDAVAVGTGWHHFAAIVDRRGEQLTPVLDGLALQPESLANMGGIERSGDAVLSQVNSDFLGEIAEVRLIEQALSLERVRAESVSLKEQAAFVSIGPEELAP